MKLAILGSSPIALEAALRFNDHGASLTWFCEGEEDFYSLFPSQGGILPVSDLGLSLLNKKSITNWKEEYLRPLKAHLAANQMVREHEVVSVTKRFLAPQEEIPGKSRFYDLFRVVFLVDPRRFIEEQKASDPEMYQKLSQEMVGSLQSTIEMFEDFDVVLDLRVPSEVPSLAVTGRALGERRVSADKIYWGLSSLHQLSELTNNSDVRELAMIGSDALAAEILIQLKEWLADPRSRLFLVSTEADPFADFLKRASSSSKEKLLAVLQEVEERLQKDYDEFHRKLREWQELDDFVQVKVPKPTEPIPQLNFFSGHNATAIDELIDRRRLFLTLEKPDFREGLKHPDNNLVDLKTIGVDRVIATSALRRKQVATSLENPEKGFFAPPVCMPSEKDAWERELEHLKGIEDEIFNLFSPATTH